MLPLSEYFNIYLGGFVTVECGRTLVGGRCDGHASSFDNWMDPNINWVFVFFEYPFITLRNLPSLQMNDK